MRNYHTKVIIILTLLLHTLPSFAQVQTKASPYLSYDWAFFELKGRVKSVTIVTNGRYSETHEFNRDGELQDEEAYTVDDEFGNPFGYTRDDKGRIDGTGNGHSSWTWNGKTVVRMDWGHMGDTATAIYLYNQDGKRIGYKDEEGKTHKYIYMTHDAKGNWTYRMLENDNTYSEKRKIVYY